MSHLHSHLPQLHEQASILNIVISFSKTQRFSPSDSCWQLSLVDLPTGVADNAWNEIKNWFCSAKTGSSSSFPRVTQRNWSCPMERDDWYLILSIISHTFQKGPYWSEITAWGFFLSLFYWGFCQFLSLFYFFFSFLVISIKQKPKLFVFLIA